MVSANRDTLIAIAGVFFLLPELIGAIALPTPQLTKGMDQQAMADAILHFYQTAGPLLIVLTLPMLVGYLTLLGMLLDRDRPTVARAIVAGMRLLPGYLATQLLISFALSVVWAIALSILALVMPQILAVLVSIVAMIYPLIRVLLIGPEMVAQRVRNPVRAIAEGLSRTRGHVLGLLLYFGPALALFMVVYGLIVIVIGAAVSPIPQIEIQRMIAEAVSAILLAAGYTYYTAMVVSAYDQLGPVGGADTTVNPFAQP